MSDVLIAWSDPPSPEQLFGEKSYGKYHAGNIFNCRCYPEPLVELHYVNWPHKVYHGGQIKTMTLAQFERLIGKGKPAKAKPVKPPQPPEPPKVEPPIVPPKEVLTAAPPSDILQVDESSEVFKKLGEEHYKALHKILNEAKTDISVAARKAWAKFEKEFKVIDPNFTGGACCSQTSGIKIDIDKVKKGDRGNAPYQTAFHEFGHNLDYLANEKLGNGLSILPISYTHEDNIFGKTLKKEAKDRVDSICKEMKAQLKEHKTDYKWLSENEFIVEWEYSFYLAHGKLPSSGEIKFKKDMAYLRLEKEIKAIPEIDRANVSDIFHGATNKKVNGGYGHYKTDYWKQDHRLSTEAFAEMYDANMANQGQLDKIKEYFPESYKVFQEILNKIAEGGKP
jgi:hypothetical protein